MFRVSKLGSGCFEELTDGTVYYQSKHKYNYHYSYRPDLNIYTNGLQKIIVVSGLDDFVEVKETQVIKSKIINDFRGWSGNTFFELQNGQVWKQDRYAYKYFYSYRPDALIMKIDGYFVLNVKGKSIRVKRVK